MKLKNKNPRSPIIALLTDFGTRDYFVGAMKGVILTINETAQIVDITHEIAPQDLNSANFTLRACYRNFPQKTIFVAVVDPGVGSDRKAILVETADYFFISPDNGLLDFIGGEAQNFRAFELTNEKFFAARVSRTFHGRDIFAPVAAHLSNGVPPDEFGGQIEKIVRRENHAPQRKSATAIEAEIIHIDRFGNLITNLKPEDLPHEFAVEINGKRIGQTRIYFAQAEIGELFSIVGSANFLEIAAFQNSAADLLKAAVGQKILILENE